MIDQGKSPESVNRRANIMFALDGEKKVKKEKLATSLASRSYTNGVMIIDTDNSDFWTN